MTAMIANRLTLSELIEGLPIEIAQGSASTVISEITEDSRQATPGCLFIARSGTKVDGRAFVNDAVKAGAVAVLADSAVEVPKGVTLVLSSIRAGGRRGDLWPGLPVRSSDLLNAVSAVMAERFFGSPSSRLKLIGVTGTNGKTTTTYLTQQLLNRAGINCGLIGTVQVDDGRTREAASLTTPPAIELSRWMSRMVANGCTACAMESSSHALHQHRTFGLNFRVGVFTNLTGDHLDYHQTMDEYLAAKAILFEHLPAASDGGVAIVNGDDPASDEIIRRTKARVIRCSEHDESAHCWAKIERRTISHTAARLVGGWGAFDANLPLIGSHNVMNALQAMAAAHALGLEGPVLHEIIETVTAPPGRLEPVTSKDHPFAVLVDYAHTDDALENVLRAVRSIVPAHGKLRVVFGCGGDRDRSKRPRMARVACKFADDVIITSDNPRTEDPQSIIDEIRTGLAVERARTTLSLIDRAAAITEAVNRAGEGDIIIIAGKGHEDYQIIGTTKRPFDDRKVAAAALRERFAGAASPMHAHSGGARSQG
jgi:UDP-N-acetylmuramoyl-L-alanyl-D-glutamate--2,6-diaminopimelate ligase